MDEAQKLLYQEVWRVMDQSIIGLQMNALQSFGMDDCLCASVGSRLAPPTARVWVHEQTVVLGIQDTKLPNLKDGIAFLEQKGYKCIVRNSGGLAVVLDKGIFNLTLVLPEADKRIDINRGYEAMFLLIKEMLSDFPIEIEAREISGSYCPGSYDLSVDGKKFAGISQRRLQKGVAVQIYLCVNGSGSERAELIKTFYAHAKMKTETKFKYPEIDRNSMASLSEILHMDLEIQDVMMRFLKVLREKSDHLFSASLTVEETPLFESYYNRIVDRNAKVLGDSSK